MWKVLRSHTLRTEQNQTTNIMDENHNSGDDAQRDDEDIAILINDWNNLLAMQPWLDILRFMYVLMRGD